MRDIRELRSLFAPLNTLEDRKEEGDSSGEDGMEGGPICVRKAAGLWVPLNYNRRKEEAPKGR